mgnify:CR=1 FL=1
MACGIAASVHDGLGDIDYGAWQMRTHAEIEQESPDAYRLWRRAPHLVRFPGGESLQDVVARSEEPEVQRLPPKACPGRRQVHHDR